jgi:uncharacterized protein (TIGR02453 family)
MLQPDTLKFLKDLKRNNTREWFDANREYYQEAKTDFLRFTGELIQHLNTMDPSLGLPEPKDCVFRINRDVRFSNDKSPYKTNMGAYIAPGGKKSMRAGYYFHLEPGDSFAAGGIYMPMPNVLKALRQAIWDDKEDFLEIIENKTFKSVFPAIYGEQLKTAPQGFPKDDPDIWLLRYKSYSLWKSIPEKDLFGPAIMENLMEIYKTMLPFNAFLNRAIEDVG